MLYVQCSEKYARKIGFAYEKESRINKQNELCKHSEVAVVCKPSTIAFAYLSCHALFI